MFKLSIYKQRFRCIQEFFLWVLKTSLDFLIIFQQTFKSSVGRPVADRREKITFTPKIRVRNTMLNFFRSLSH